jgi:hypothetical protein
MWHDAEASMKTQGEKSSNGNGIHLGSRFPPRVYRSFQELAARNERSIAAELRIAVHEHLERQQAPVKEV